MDLREKMRRGDYCIGPFLKAASPSLIEVLGYAGWDFALLDMEHGPLSYETLEHMILAAERVGIAPIVRVEAVAESPLIRPLDKGAAGLVVPHIDTAEMARDVIRFSRYAPVGERGMDIYARAAQYSHMPKQEYLRKANESLMVMQIEGREGLKNLDAILEVAGSDVIFIGPYDLSQSLGHPGEIDHPEVVATIQRIVDAVRRSGRHVGIYADDAALARKWIAVGVQFIALCVDTAIFYRACKQMAAEVRG